jgi:hypothetical protein
MAKRNRSTTAHAVAVEAVVPAVEAVVPEAVVPEAVVPEAVVPEAVVPEAVVPQWQPTVRYQTTVNNALCAGEAVVPAGAPVLVAVGPAPKLSGTARAAAYAALCANMGQPQPVVLAAVTLAEVQWHHSKGRTPAGLAPAGWLGLFGARFAVVPATPAPDAQ